MSSEQKVLLWGTPRSLSTAFQRAMMNLPECQTVLASFAHAYYFGEQRTSKRYSEMAPKDGCSYSTIKSHLENPTHGRNVTFAKEMSYTVMWGNDFTEHLPEGYKHTFLLRNPKKSIPSLYKATTSKLLTEWDYFEPAECGFKEMQEIFNYVTQELKQKAIVVEADDLATQPESILRQYCDALGLQYTDSLVAWRPETLDMEILGEWPLGWFGNLMASTGFLASAAEEPSQETLDTLPAEVKSAIDQALPYYDYMKKFKLNP